MTTRTQQSELKAREERQSVSTRLRQVDLTLERRKEKQALYAWLDAFAHQESRLCAILGEPGSGKSQFLKKVARRSQNRNVLFVSNDARTTQGPFGIFKSWIDAIQMSDLPASVSQELSTFVNTRRLLSILIGQTNDLPAHPTWRIPSTNRGKERHQQLATELIKFFTMVSSHRPLLLATANVDHLPPETTSLLTHVSCGLSDSPVGFIVTSGLDRTILAPFKPLSPSQITIGPLTRVQSDGLIRQVCKRHILNRRFVDAMSEHAGGNPSRLLLLLWYLIETRYLVYTKAGWAAPTDVPWSTLPDDLHAEAAVRLVDLSPKASNLVKGMSVGLPHVELDTLLRLVNVSRSQFETLRDEVNDIYPIFNPNRIEIDPIASRSIFKAIRKHCLTTAEASTWCHRIAGHLAETRPSTGHREIAALYEAAGKAEAALTYRIAASHRAKSVACYDDAAEDLQAAITHCTPSSPLHARLLIRLADLQSLRGDGDAARSSVSSAIRIAESEGSLKLEADAKFFLAGLETLEGALAEGLVRLDQSLALYKAAGRCDGQLGVLGHMTSVYRALKMWSQSDAINDEMLALAELESNPLRIAVSRVNAAISSAVRGDRSCAAEHLYRALRICRKNGYWDLITYALIDFADASQSSGPDLDQDRYYVAAVASARRRFDEVRELESLYKLSAAYLRANAHRKARLAADQVIDLAGSRGDTRYRGDATRIAAVCAWKNGNEEEAAKLFEEALSLAQRADDEGMRARILADQGDFASTRRPDQAEPAWREARNIFCRLGEHAEVLRMDRNLVRHAYEHARQPEKYSQAF